MPSAASPLQPVGRLARSRRIGGRAHRGAASAARSPSCGMTEFDWFAAWRCFCWPGALLNCIFLDGAPPAGGRGRALAGLILVADRAFDLQVLRHLDHAQLLRLPDRRRRHGRRSCWDFPELQHHSSSPPCWRSRCRCCLIWRVDPFRVRRAVCRASWRWRCLAVSVGAVACECRSNRPTRSRASITCRISPAPACSRWPMTSRPGAGSSSTRRPIGFGVGRRRAVPSAGQAAAHRPHA